MGVCSRGGVVECVCVSEKGVEEMIFHAWKILHLVQSSQTNHVYLSLQTDTCTSREKKTREHLQQEARIVLFIFAALKANITDEDHTQFN